MREEQGALRPHAIIVSIIVQEAAALAPSLLVRSNPRVESAQPARHRFPGVEFSHVIQLRALHLLQKEPKPTLSKIDGCAVAHRRARVCPGEELVGCNLAHWVA